MWSRRVSLGAGIQGRHVGFRGLARPWAASLVSKVQSERFPGGHESQMANLGKTLDMNPLLADELVESLSHNTKLRIANAILDSEAQGGRSYSEYLARRHRQNIMIREISFSMGNEIKEKMDINRDGKVSNQELNEYLSNLLKLQSEEEKQVKVPTSTQMYQLALLSGIPFIGFGFLDNAIMLVAGDLIDTGIGRVLGISTLAAAGLGNMISDVAGLGLGGYIEASAKRLGLKDPKLTLQQMNTSRVRFLQFIATSIGICIGCLLGMIPLLFMNPEENNMAEMFEVLKKSASESGTNAVSVSVLLQNVEEAATMLGETNATLVTEYVNKVFPEEDKVISFREFKEVVYQLRKNDIIERGPSLHFGNLLSEAIFKR